MKFPDHFAYSARTAQTKVLFFIGKRVEGASKNL